MKFDIIGRKYLWFIISALVIIPGLISIAMQGFNLGIDFTGGTLLDLKFESPVAVSQIRDVLKDYKLESSTIQLASNTQNAAATNVFIRTHVLGEDVRRNVLAGLKSKLGNFEVLRVEKVGAVIGSELTRQAICAVLASWLLMIAYISYRFEFRFAIAGILALIHDILVVLGLSSILRIELDSSFVAAILTIIGYSINDTIVIFDRIRENLKVHRKNESFTDLVNRSIWQTMRRSIYTVVTVVFATAALLIYGGETTKTFALVLLIGFCSGAYSSVFTASPIWVMWREYKEGRRNQLKAKGAK